MKFLEAQEILDAFEGGEEFRLRVLLSGTLEPLDLYTRAAAAERGFAASVFAPPFNTLRQSLMEDAEESVREVALLLPWDFVPSADWRSGVPDHQSDEEADQDVRELVSLLGSSRRELLYLPAPIPPLFTDATGSSRLEAQLLATARSLGARTLERETFSLKNYLGHGNPVASSSMGIVARALVDSALAPERGTGKVLVTDFDNTLWAGVVGEDGVEGLAQEPEGIGYPHFLFQTFLKRLKNSGVLIAGVTRNDPDVARAPFRKGGTHLGEEDFVKILASYEAKSAQIRALAESLNLGLDSFAFVDDNPVELAEVSRALPGVVTVRFPSETEELPEFFRYLSRLFHRDHVTEEDRERTELYRTRVAGMVPKEAEGADLREFLRDLKMVLTVHDRTEADRARAVQLINKTNQFNLNGMRLSDQEVDDVIAGGGRLFTATLRDRHGSHGEILSLLLDADGVVRSFVMSCRVFQRRVEHAFLLWLADRGESVRGLHHRATERNEPLRRFLTDDAFDTSAMDDEGVVALDLDRFRESHGEVRDLFTLIEGASFDDG